MLYLKKLKSEVEVEESKFSFLRVSDSEVENYFETELDENGQIKRDEAGNAILVLDQNGTKVFKNGFSWSDRAEWLNSFSEEQRAEIDGMYPDVATEELTEEQKAHNAEVKAQMTAQYEAQQAADAAASNQGEQPAGEPVADELPAEQPADEANT